MSKKAFKKENPFPSAKSLREEIVRALPYASKEQILDGIQEAKKDSRFCANFSKHFLDGETYAQLIDQGYKVTFQYGTDGKLPIGFKVIWF